MERKISERWFKRGGGRDGEVEQNGMEARWRKEGCGSDCCPACWTPSSLVRTLVSRMFPVSGHPGPGAFFLFLRLFLPFYFFLLFPFFAFFLGLLLVAWCSTSSVFVPQFIILNYIIYFILRLKHCTILQLLWWKQDRVGDSLQSFSDVKRSFGVLLLLIQWIVWCNLPFQDLWEVLFLLPTCLCRCHRMNKRIRWCFCGYHSSIFK